MFGLRLLFGVVRGLIFSFDKRLYFYAVNELQVDRISKCL